MNTAGKAINHRCIISLFEVQITISKRRDQTSRMHEYARNSDAFLFFSDGTELEFRPH
jgi:hypothetical protein